MPDAMEGLKSISPELSEEARFIVNGMSDQEEREIIDSVHDIYREYRAGGPTQSLDDTLKNLKTAIGASILGGASGNFFAAQRIRDQFNFVTMPAFPIAKTAVGDYQQAIVDMLQTQTSISFSYGRIFGGILSGVYMVLREGGLVTKLGKSLKAISTGARVAAEARAPAEAALAEGAGATGQIEVIAGIVVDIVATAVLQHVGQDIGQALTNRYARYRAQEIFATKLLDKQRIVDDFTAYSAAMAGYKGFNGNNGYQIMDVMRSQTLYGLPLSRLGYDYTSLEPVLSFMSSQARVNSIKQLEGYTSQSALMASMYGDTTGQTQRIYAQLSLTGEHQKAVSEATSEFEKFFVSLAGGKTPQLAQLRLVGELTTFAKNYGYAVKMNENAIGQVAELQQFMTKSSVGKMQTTAPTQKLVTGLDAVLQKGLTGENPRARELIDLAGITQAQAMQGLTGNAGMLNNILKIISHETSIRKTDFNSKGELNQAALERFYMYSQYSLGIDNPTQQAVLVALKAYLGGDRVSTVKTKYLEALNKKTAGTYMDRNFFMTNWTEAFASGNVKLSKVILTNADVLGEIDRAMINMFVNKVPAIVNMVGQFGLTVEKTFRSVLNPRTNKGLSELAAQYNTAKSKLPTSLNVPLAKWGLTTSMTVTDLISSLSKDTVGTVGPTFITKVAEISKRLGIHPEFLLAVMEAEDPTFSTSQFNLVGSGAVGLIQFMESTALGLGTTTQALASMTRTQQLDYVEKYLQPYSKEFHSGDNTIADVYAAVFWPAAIGKPLNYVIAKRGTAAYRENSSLDYGDKGYITKQDLAIRVLLSYNRITKQPFTATLAKPVNLKIDAHVNFVNKAALARSIEAGFHRNINAQ